MPATSVKRAGAGRRQQSSRAVGAIFQTLHHRWLPLTTSTPKFDKIWLNLQFFIVFWVTATGCNWLPRSGQASLKVWIDWPSWPLCPTWGAKWSRPDAYFMCVSCLFQRVDLCHLVSWHRTVLNCDVYQHPPKYTKMQAYDHALGTVRKAGEAQARVQAALKPVKLSKI